MVQPIKSFTKDRLLVNIFGTSAEMGNASANFVAKNLQMAIQAKGAANLILATGASQFAFLDALKNLYVEWNRITVFHLDEYIGLSDQHPASFRKYLKERILDEVKPSKIYLLNGDAPDQVKETKRYAKLLLDHPTDVACIGIGENGHIAFNDPAIADFDDPLWVKVADLDHACRMQQLGEGWFPAFEDVPEQALSLTIPSILRSKVISCVVPEERKAEAVYNTLYGKISTACPASILRSHPNTILFLDAGSACKINE